MEKIYIILTHTGTNLSKLIKNYTKDEFSHVSIALDRELKHMYSFGRLNPYNPIWAGFVHEYIDKGTFKRFYLTKAKVYELSVTKEQYEIVKNTIQSIRSDFSRISAVFSVVLIAACTATDSVFEFSLCHSKGTTSALKETITTDSKILVFIFICHPLKFEIYLMCLRVTFITSILRCDNLNKFAFTYNRYS